MGALERIGRGGTLLVTWATKVLGLAAAYKQFFVLEHPTTAGLIVAAFLVAGGQGLESAVLAVIDRVMAEGRAPER